jgi:hypothetical protein
MGPLLVQLLGSLLQLISFLCNDYASVTARSTDRKIQAIAHHRLLEILHNVSAGNVSILGMMCKNRGVTDDVVFILEVIRIVRFLQGQGFRFAS